MWSLWSAIESVFCPKLSSEMIWCGRIDPCSSIRRRTVCSAIPPLSWCPRIGVPLIAEMSTALPEECSEMLPDEVRSECPDFRQLTVGRSPDSARYSSVASTRRSIWCVLMSFRPPA